MVPCSEQRKKHVCVCVWVWVVVCGLRVNVHVCVHACVGVGGCLWFAC